MIGWIILAIYVLGYVFLWRSIVWALVNDSSFGKIDGEDIVMGTVMGTIITFLWPLILPGIIVHKIYRHRGIDVIYFIMPRHLQRAKRLDERERKIAELERELLPK